MQDHTGKTKTAMLMELESIKGLLLEEDIVPILKELIDSPANAVTDDNDAPVLNDIVIEANDDNQNLHIAGDSHTQANLFSDIEPPLLTIEAEATPTAQLPIVNSSDEVALKAEQSIQEEKKEHEEQQDFFNFSMIGDLPAEPILQPITESDSLVAFTTSNKYQKLENNPSLSTPAENPFLPEYIRVRLHGNNPPPSFAIDDSASAIHTKRSAILSANADNELPTISRQQIIDAIIQDQLPTIERELRGRLELMSKKTLQDLLNEST